jgi:hypothetical protein
MCSPGSVLRYATTYANHRRVRNKECGHCSRWTRIFRKLRNRVWLVRDCDSALGPVGFSQDTIAVMNRPESPSNDAFVSLVSLVSRLVSAVLALALGLIELVLAFVLVPLSLPPVRAPSTRTNFLSVSPLSVTTDHSSPAPLPVEPRPDFLPLISSAPALRHHLGQHAMS